MAALARWRGSLQVEEQLRQERQRAQRQNNTEPDVEAQQQPAAQPQDAFNAIVQAMAPPAAAAAAATAPPKLSRKQRQERESNATLFGPSLATYFPSSSSTPSTGTTPAATTAQQQNAQQAATSPATEQPPAFAPLTQISSINSATLRRPRLGSSGRARGASLSNLSLSHPPHDPASPHVPPSPAQQARPLYGTHRRQYTTDSTWSWNHQHQSADPEDDLLDATTTSVIPDAALPDGPLPLADAIQIGTVHRWLQRAAHGGGATLHPNSISTNPTDATTPSAAAGATITTNADSATEPGADGTGESIPLTTLGGLSPSTASPLPPLSPGAVTGSSVCSILQSYVNLKRNTFRLTLGPAASTSYQYELTTPSAAPLPSHVLTPAPSAPILTHPTHILHFEYDCAAPRCAIHVFVRASRKHGSWNTALAHADYPQLLIDHQQKSTAAAAGNLLSPQPPPHILGFPILAATTILASTTGEGVDIDNGAGMGTATSSSAEAYHLPRGFAQKRSVALRLDMSLYAPPSFSKKKSGDADRNEEGDGEEKLDLNVENAATAGAIGPTPDLAAEVSATAAAESKTKELAKDKEDKKLDKETLKAAIVVEALDEHGKPLPDPNLQTTYLRLSSVPAASPTAATAVKASDGTLRIWSAQVEAQEAEIGPHRFQLQELFALSSRPPPASLAAVPATTSTQDVTAGGGGGADGEAGAAGEEGAGGDAAAAGGEVAPLAEIPTEVMSPSDDAGTTPITPTTAAYLPPGSPPDAPPNNGATGTATSTLFPASTTTSQPFLPTADEGTTGSECLICLTSPPSTLLLPCTHGLCLECAIQLRESVKNARDAERRRGKMPRRKYACPVCRRAYTSMLHLSTADEKQVAQASAHGIV
ncbi:hypothetical protein OC846_004794 [Tilletia horrida]|uniref:RING-type domain-containing protein n=1 Tax=Tilletia horrida TaxID=155126 RepID=A0AAN6GP43_9BASI|nr:hypothetical protein OC846_004794 [Tilletia horrida]KAK0563084.1 hypothetical protein OC861_004991 [Tilletia horrida]